MANSWPRAVTAVWIFIALHLEAITRSNELHRFDICVKLAASRRRHLRFSPAKSGRCTLPSGSIMHRFSAPGKGGKFKAWRRPWSSGDS